MCFDFAFYSFDGSVFADFVFFAFFLPLVSAMLSFLLLHFVLVSQQTQDESYAQRKQKCNQNGLLTGHLAVEEWEKRAEREQMKKTTAQRHLKSHFIEYFDLFFLRLTP